MNWMFPNLETLTQWFISSAAPVMIGILPVLLHLFDKLLETFSPFSSQTLRRMMADDKGNDLVKSIGKSEAAFEEVKSYFDFDRDVHLIVSLIAFNIFSLYVAQTECTHSMLQANAITFTYIIVLILFWVAFWWK